MVTTATQLLEGALRKLNVLTQGESLAGDQATDGLRLLQQFVESLTLQPFSEIATERQVFDVVSDQGTYTIGDGADFDVARPEHIANAAILLTTFTPETEVPTPVITDQAWQAIQQKDLTSAQWTQVYYQPLFPASGADEGFGSVSLWPVPDNATNDLVLYLPVGVTAFANLTTEYALPPGYARMYEFNLCLELADEYGRSVPPMIAHKADESMKLIKRQNARRSDLGFDLALAPSPRGVYNIYTDT